MKPIFSRDVLKKMQASLDVPSSFIDELIRIYFSDSPALVAAIEKHVEEMNFELLIRSAHSLKSSSAALGGLRIAEHCRDIEMTEASDVCWPVMKAKALAIRGLFDQTCEELKNAQFQLKKSA